MVRWGLLLALGTGACAEPEEVTSVDAGVVVELPPPVTEPAPPPRVEEPPRPVEVPSPMRAGEMLSIPASLYPIGSAPGTEGRRAMHEADLVPVELTAFEIDRLPYPNDPDAPPHTGVTPREAAELCEAEGKRLCSELEWERACKGDEPERRFPMGDSFASCDDPLACETPTGALQMGIEIAEWTASPGTRGLEASGETSIFRGAAPDSEAWTHRCAARRAGSREQRSRHIGFRCCRGPEQEASYPSEPDRSRFRSREIALAELRAILASIPEVAAIAPSFQPTSGERAQRAVDRGAGTTHGWELVDGVLRWAPVPGEEIWVVAGEANGEAHLVAFFPMPDGTYRHAASLRMAGEPGPIAVAFTPPETHQLLWSVEWGRMAEGGALEYRDDGRLEITHR